MNVASRKFNGRRERVTPDLPPGQYLTRNFPVLQAGPPPGVDLDTWQFTIGSEAGGKYTIDIHCVTQWSKLGTTWQGVSPDTLCENVEAAGFAFVRSYGGYTTNMPLEDLLDGKEWIAYRFDGEDLSGSNGGPARLFGAAPVLLEVGEVGHRHRPPERGRAGVLGAARLPRLRDPWREQRYTND